ncbi:hypothetical protein CerSpe_210650 [Prunus speciosa]
MEMAGDPDILTDFIAPPNGTVHANFFTYIGFRVVVGEGPPAALKVLKASLIEFPALNGQSVSYAVIQFPSGTVNPPHTHLRAAELLLLVYGTLEVGFVDTKDNLFTQTLRPGDLFVFPKGLLHFQYNADSQKPALAIAAFGSASAGAVSVPGALFSTSIGDKALAISLNTDVATLQKLKAGLASKP